MLVVAKKPHINLKLEGKGIRKVISLIKKEYPDVEIRKESDNEELVLLTSTDWYKDMKKSMTPGAALKVYRGNAKLTMVELSEKCGIAQSHLSAMENDKRNIGKISAQKLAKALGCEYKRFL